MSNIPDFQCNFRLRSHDLWAEGAALTLGNGFGIVKIMNRRWWCAMLCLALVSSAPVSEAAFVWSPQTGWIGPGGAVKDSPEEQLDYAKGFFDKGDYHRARVEFKKLLTHYKKSHEAPDAQYYLGRSYEEDRDYYKAFQEYRRTLETYPSTSRFEEILERMYQIGNYFLSGKKRKLLGTAALLPARDKAAEIFQVLVEDGPFSQYGELAQYKLGIAYLSLGEYEQAVSAFEQLIDRYPKSTLVDDARFQLAQASLKGSFKAGYDPHSIDQAIGELQSFVSEYSKSDLAPEAVAHLQTLRERRAADEFQVAQFYERRRHPESAVLYYQEIINRYADTTWAPKAISRIQILQPPAP